MAGDVDPAARIAVLVPGAADTGVLLDDLERDAGLAQPDRGQQARCAQPDDQHRKAFRQRRFAGQMNGAGVLAGQVHLLGVQRDIRSGHRFAGDPVHDFVNHRGLETRGRRTTRIAPRTDRLEGVAAQLRLLLGVEHALELVLDELARANRAAKDRRVTGDLHNRSCQRRHRQLRQRRGDGVVAVDDGLGVDKAVHRDLPLGTF